MSKEPPPEPVIPLPVRAGWWLWTHLTWPLQVRELKRHGFRRTGWMEWSSGPPDPPPPQVVEDAIVPMESRRAADPR